MDCVSGRPESAIRTSVTSGLSELGTIGEAFEVDLCGVLFTASSALGDANADHEAVVFTGASGLPLGTAC
jgi:hypothetical protein